MSPSSVFLGLHTGTSGDPSGGSGRWIQYWEPPREMSPSSVFLVLHTGTSRDPSGGSERRCEGYYV
ncbi:unnamed protein product [Staurois parvus]|uniref:Uncharacterized protein n=1 Tax=Staurois parvus TaxID=386267 RepID=A0ABN9CD08_9NEOB|nr:unnamed protein product [Staurois parvus]